MPKFHEKDVVAIARKAGDAIMAALRQPTKLDIQYKEADSPVSVADLRANAIVLQGLRKLTPDIPILSEEMSPEEQKTIMKQPVYWCIDPLDGTPTALDYAHGLKAHDGFSVQIALIKNGTPVFGICHYPARGELVKKRPLGVSYFTNATGNEAFRQEGEHYRKRILAGRMADGSVSMAGGYQAGQPTMIAGVPVENVPAIGGGRIVSVACGKAAMGYMGNTTANKFGFWDLAAGHAILRAVGGELVTLPQDSALHAQPGTLAASVPVRYDGTQSAPGHEGQPFLPPCLAAHKETLRQLGMTREALLPPRRSADARWTPGSHSR